MARKPSTKTAAQQEADTYLLTLGFSEGLMLDTGPQVRRVLYAAIRNVNLTEEQLLFVKDEVAGRSSIGSVIRYLKNEIPESDDPFGDLVAGILATFEAARR